MSVWNYLEIGAWIFSCVGWFYFFKQWLFSRQLIELCRAQARLNEKLNSYLYQWQKIAVWALVMCAYLIFWIYWFFRRRKN